MFGLSVGDVQINLHNTISYQQDPLAVGQLSNTSQFPHLINDAGVTLSLPLGDITLSASYDHLNQWVFGGTNGVLSEEQLQFQTDTSNSDLNYQEDTLTPTVSYKLSQTINVGLTASFSDTRYQENYHNNNTSISSGPFVNGQLTKNLSINAQAGYIVTAYDSGGSSNDNSNTSSYYGSIAITHKINDAFTQTLSAGKDYLPGLTSNYTERIYAEYTLGWQALTYLSLGSNLSVENLDDSGATLSQNSNRFQAGLNLDYTLATHVNLFSNYQYSIKDSNISGLSYYQNVISLGCNYQF